VKYLEGQEYTTINNEIEFLKSLCKNKITQDKKLKKLKLKHNVDGRIKVDFASNIYTLQVIDQKNHSQKVSNIITVSLNNFKEKDSLKFAKTLYSFPRNLYNIKHVNLNNKTINLEHIISPDMGAIYGSVNYNDKIQI
jgi:hypothetical protein